MPLFIDGEQVVSVGDFPSAAGAQRGLLWARGGHRLQKTRRGGVSERVCAQQMSYNTYNTKYSTKMNC